VRNAFPDAMCSLLGLGGYPGCPIPPDFFLYVNLTLIWLVAPICAILARRWVVFGFVFYSIVVVNALVHIGGAIATRSYNPGLVTAIVLFLPASIWAGRVLLRHRDPRLGWWRLVVIVVLGAVANGFLMLTLMLFTHGVIPAVLLNALQVFNASLLLIVGGLLQRRLPRPAAPASPTTTGAVTS
jgi:hypothetical protein